MTEKKQIKAPKSGAGDAAHAVVRAALSAIPTAGGPAAELFTALVPPPWKSGDVNGWKMWGKHSKGLNGPEE